MKGGQDSVVLADTATESPPRGKEGGPHIKCEYKNDSYNHDHDMSRNHDYCNIIVTKFVITNNMFLLDSIHFYVRIQLE